MTCPPARLSVLPGLLFLFASATYGQGVPPDFEIFATAGGLTHGETASVHISADGQGSYIRFEPDDPTAPLIESNDFTLSGAQVGQLWQAIQTNGFFDLEAIQTNEDIEDRTFAELTIVADGATHTVRTQNVAVAEFDAIVSTLNGLTPGDDDLIYDTTEPFTVVPLDVCEQPGKRGTASGLHGKDTRLVATEVDPLSGAEFSSVGGRTSADATISGQAHPGTQVAYHLGLMEAVERGIVMLTGKSGYFGDTVSITADNSANNTSDRLVATLYLEFWGPEASADAAKAVEEAIERIWGGRTTSDGKELDVDVVTRVRPGGSEAPGTSGYHQIRMVESGISDVVGRGTSFNVNEGAGQGTWKTTGNKLDRTYAHEAGHLLGFPDQYDEYNKRKGLWRTADGDSLTNEQLAKIIDHRYPDLTEDYLKTWLESVRRATAPKPGSEYDLMGNKIRDPIQADIDALGGQTGFVVEVRPSDILINKNASLQNMVVTRNEDIFVPPGGTTTLNGIYAACLDRHKGEPALGNGFDVAPPLTEWSGFEAAGHLQSFLEYVDREDLYCGSHSTTQLAVWRLTDNFRSGDAATNDFIDALLRQAGVDVDDRFLSFPHVTESNPQNPETATLTPPELFAVAIESSVGDIIPVDRPVTLTADLRGPTRQGISVEYNWTMATAPGTEANLSQAQGETTVLTVRDNAPYRVRVAAVMSDGISPPDTVRSSRLFSAPNARTETFESGQLRRGDPFRWRTDGDQPWVVNSTAPNTGTFSAASGDISDLETSQLRVQFEHAAPGPFAFAVMVSSELVWDALRFELDGVELGRWSGNVDWGAYWQMLPAGAHTATWTYEKDGLPYRSEGLDRAWVDDVYFPPDAVFTDIETSDGEQPATSYELFQNYPNPFSSSTMVAYTLPEPQDVSLVVYDMSGRQVAVLVDERQSAGRHQAVFVAQELAGGVYYYELRAGPYSHRKAMVMLH